MSPADLDDVVLAVYTDADWNGDAATTKSTNGLWIELHSPSSGRSWGLTWRAWKQTCSSSSTAEAETINLSSGLRSEGWPLQTLLEACLGLLPWMRLKVDNQQAILAVQRGCSKKLKHLQRTHRVSIGTLHEAITTPESRVVVDYEDTKSHKGDMFTKALQPTQFAHAVAHIGMKLHT